MGEDRLWHLEERYNEHMLRLVSEEAVKFRRERRLDRRSVDPECRSGFQMTKSPIIGCRLPRWQLKACAKARIMRAAPVDVGRFLLSGLSHKVAPLQYVVEKLFE